MGLKDIVHKLGLLFIPLVVFASSSPSCRTKCYIFTGFTVSSVLVASIALIIGLYNFQNGGGISSLFYHQLSNNVGLHAVYLSCYLVFSAFIIIHKGLFPNGKRLSIVPLTILVFYIIGLLILLSSKTLLAVFLFALIIYTLLTLNRGKKFYWGVAVTIFLNIVIIIILMNTPYTSHRFEQISKTNFEVLNEEKFNYDTEFNGLSLRLLFWKFAFLINQRENSEFTGVGTGDSKDKLNEIYREYNLYQGNPQIEGDTGYQNYNTHNQFVETYLKLGAVGLLYLILYFTFAIYYSILKKNVLFTIWLIIFISFSLTETTLQVNKGIIFFAFFISLFLKISSNDKPSFLKNYSKSTELKS